MLKRGKMDITKEHNIEIDFINKLKKLKYIYRDDIRDNDSLEQNFREKFETLNQVKLTNREFAKLKEQIISPDVFKSAKILRQKNTMYRDDDTILDYTIVDIKKWCKNSFEVINQLHINTTRSYHRYDVIILINGVPIIQVELKTLEISPRRAIQQIIDYKNDQGNGYSNTLLAFVQLFVVSNRSKTQYFANNNDKHFSFDADERFLPIYEYADKENNKITHLDDFCDKFLSKCTISEIISRYMVIVENEKQLLMMRPYQIYAVKAIVECIDQNSGNGYIWHTTGSGKTLTSFKASTLLKDNLQIHKCLFVVDRKDLDRQTREEFNKFQKGCVEENTNTYTLVQRLLSDDYSDKVIVTTIQKLGLALDDKKNYKQMLEPLQDKRVVLIFDECHRSQFGENHKAIKEFFPLAQLFGFTGTPIFAENSSQIQVTDDMGSYRTTKEVFQTELHSYTITNAIEDGNVLRFHVDYYKADKPDKNALYHTKKSVAKTIISKHLKATSNRRFNSIFATGSINEAIEYFKLFEGMEHNLNIACVFSPPVSMMEKDDNYKDIKQLQNDLSQEKIDNQENPSEKKEALIYIINNYNQKYNTSHNINSFDIYYQDIQQRIKDHKYSNTDLDISNKIDITIVVDMLLTGFDSKYLNTLYVDKNLKDHGLIQAFSRTNRVLNDTKPYGNILDFRAQQKSVDSAVALFSGEKLENPVEIWLVEPAIKVIDKLSAAKTKLDEYMASQGVQSTPQDVANLKGDEAKAGFVNVFKEVQKLKTQLDQYTDLTDTQAKKIENIFSIDDIRAFKGVYIDIAQELRSRQDKVPPSSPTIEQLDFEFVLFASDMVDYDYIMKLISQYTQDKPNNQKMTKDQLIGLIASDSKFMDDKDDIIAYIDTLGIGTKKGIEDIVQGFERFRQDKHTKHIADVALEFGIDIKSLDAFVRQVIQRKIFDGERFTELFEPLGLGWKERGKKELQVVKQLSPTLKELAQHQEISGLSAYE